MGKIFHEFELDRVTPELQGLTDFRLVEYELKTDKPGSDEPNKQGPLHYWATDMNGKSVHLSVDKIGDSIKNTYRNPENDSENHNSDSSFDPVLPLPNTQIGVDTVDSDVWADLTSTPYAPNPVLTPPINPDAITSSQEPALDPTPAIDLVLAGIAARFPIAPALKAEIFDDTADDMPQFPEEESNIDIINASLASRYKLNRPSKSKVFNDPAKDLKDPIYGPFLYDAGVDEVYVTNTPEKKKNNFKNWRNIGVIATTATTNALNKTTSFVSERKVSVAEMSPNKKRVAMIIGAAAGLAVVAAGAYLVYKNYINQPNGKTTEAPLPERKSNAPTSNVTVKAPDLQIINPDVPPVDVPVDSTAEAINDAISSPSPAIDTGMIDSQISSMPVENVAEFADLDASVIDTSPEVMPWTNVVEAGSLNPVDSIESGLSRYNDVYSRQFVLGSGGMFWEGNHVISPPELEQYNHLMQQLAEAASDLDDVTTGLPVTA